MKARIEKVKGQGDAVWLFVDREKNRPKRDAEYLEHVLIDEEGDIAYALLESELPVIRDAINEYLSKNDC